MATLKSKYDDLEKMLKDMMESFNIFSSDIQSTTSEISKSVELITENMQKPTSQPVMDPIVTITNERSMKPWSDLRSTRQIISRNPVPVNSNQVQNGFKNILLSPSDPRSRNGFFNCQTPPDTSKKVTQERENVNWEVAKSRKTKKKLIVGAGQSSSIKSVKPIKITSVFLTRCDPVTTTEEINSHLTDTNKW